jgi:hypothetical protein
LDTFFPLSLGVSLSQREKGRRCANGFVFAQRLPLGSRPLCVPKQQLEIKSEFVYKQNLQLFISAAAKKK